VQALFCDEIRNITTYFDSFRCILNVKFCENSAIFFAFLRIWGLKCEAKAKRTPWSFLRSEAKRFASLSQFFAIKRIRNANLDPWSGGVLLLTFEGLVTEELSNGLIRQMTNYSQFTSQPELIGMQHLTSSLWGENNLKIDISTCFWINCSVNFCIINSKSHVEAKDSWCAVFHVIHKQALLMKFNFKASRQMIVIPCEESLDPNKIFYYF